MKLDLPKPVQGISFNYIGSKKVRMKAYNKKARKVVADWIIEPGRYFVEGPAIDSIIFLAFKVKLQNIQTLNLYEGIPLSDDDFDTVAVINTKYPLVTESVDLERVLKRCQVDVILGDLFEEYSRPEGTFWKELQGIVGERNVIYGDPEQLERYSHDEIADPHYASMPEAVVKPIAAEEISQIMQLANREKIPVTPRGAGSASPCRRPRAACSTCSGSCSGP